MPMKFIYFFMRPWNVSDRSYLFGIIISKVVAFDLSDAGINQRPLEMSFVERIQHKPAKFISDLYGINLKVRSRRTFGTNQEGKQ